MNKQGASTFASTKQSAWLNEHCWEYGFIIRYTKEKEKITGFEAEPWHIRYVGVEHAMYMKEHDLCLEEYVQGLEDGSIPNPLLPEAAPAEPAEDAEETAEGAGEEGAGESAEEPEDEYEEYDPDAEETETEEV